MPTDIVQHAVDVALMLESHHMVCNACRVGHYCEEGRALLEDWQNAASVFFLARVSVRRSNGEITL